MIEVEKKFQPTEEQLSKIITSSVFVGRYKIHDIYYDFKDYRLIKDKIRLRLRREESNSGVIVSFELKIRNDLGGDYEIRNEEKIKNYFNTKKELKKFVEDELVPFMDYFTDRTKYNNGDFEIDIDKCDFGYELCEIELMVENEDEIINAEKKIIDFASQFDMEFKKLSSKGKEYLKLRNPELHEQIYGEKLKEIKMK